MRHLRRLFASTTVTFLVCGVSGCVSEVSPPPMGRHVGPALAELDVRADMVSTDPVIASSNLRSTTEAWLRATERQPTIFDHRRVAIEYLLTRIQFFGTFDDFDTIEALSDGAIEMYPTFAPAFELRSRARSAVHRFTDARADIETAVNLGSRTATQRAALIDVALGDDLTRALADVDARVAVDPSFDNQVERAAVLAALGRFDDADATYRAALAAYGDVSPFSLGWVAFQRGVMWAEMADRADLAEPLYREAVRRVPEYVVANVHLAEIEHETGRNEAAIARLRSIVDRTTDPEPAGKLGDWLMATAPTEGAAYIARARERYDVLLARHPAAFADHGSEFFAGPGGDAPRGLELARANLALRPTARAYIVALGAAHAVGDDAILCELYRSSAALEVRSVNLEVERAAVRSRCE